MTLVTSMAPSVLQRGFGSHGSQFVKIVAIAFAVAFNCSLAGGLVAQEAVLERQATSSQEADSEDKAVANKTDGKLETPEFLRVKKDGKKMVALQTANITYRRVDEKDGAEVTLVGAVHIAEPTYYSRLNQLFRQYDALLYEMVMDPEMGVPDPEERGVSPVSTIQVGMKDALGLSFQLDEIDYKAKNFVHADMTPTEFFDTMEARKEGLLQIMLRSIGSGLAMQSSGKGGSDLDLIAGLVSGEKGMRRAFASQMQMMDGQMAGLTGEDGKSTLITERNAKAFDVLKSELAAGKKKLGIFYGAGHLKDMHERLIKEYGMEPVKTEWMDAWDLK